MSVLVIAPHPDDEVLGVGGTIHRLSNDGHHVHVAIATKGWSPLFKEEQVAQVRAEAEQAAEVLGAEVSFMDFPVTKLHTVPEHELNRAFDRLIEAQAPEWVFLPHPSDRHEDHRQLFDAAMVALRPLPSRSYVKRIYCYETVSETHWSIPGMETPFQPQVYLDITKHIDAKVAAMEAYVSQVQPSPQARSIQAIRALSRWRGSVVGLADAEAFMLVREVL